MSVSQMKKLTVIAPVSDADAITRRLMNLRCVEINATHSVGSTEIVRKHPDVENSIRASQEKLSNIQKALPILRKYTSRKKTFGRIVHKVNKSEFRTEHKDDTAYDAVEKVLDIEQKRLNTLKLIENLNREIESYVPWIDYEMPLISKIGQNATVVFGSFPGKMNMDEVDRLDAEIENDGFYAEFVYQDEQSVYASVTFHNSDEKKALQKLGEYGFVPSPVALNGTDAKTASLSAERNRQKAETDLEKYTAELHDLSVYLDDIEILFDIVSTDIVVFEQLQKLTLTQTCVILNGWVPSHMMDKVTDALSHFDCFAEDADPDEGEEPPVQLRNNRFATDFEWVVGMYSYPKYGTYDPTFIMSIFYFIFFGMMFADVGYGLLLSLGCWLWIKFLNPEPGFKRMLSMFGICGVSCMIMGVLFGGWFGDLPTAIMESFLGIENASETPIGKFFSSGLIFNPVNSPLPFLVLSLAVGEIHLITGMAINLVETGKQGKWMEGICSNVPYWIFFAGVDLMAPSFLLNMMVTDPSPETIAKLSNLSSVGLIVFFIGLGCILCFKGWGSSSIGGWIVKGLGGLYNIISLVSDLLSYSRVLALGLVASVIASIINMLTDLGASGFIGFIVMLIVLVFGHILNIAINLLGTFVHAARLQYIEFFGKFYEDGGVPFKPVVPIEKYTEE